MQNKRARNGRLPISLFLQENSLIRIWKFPVLLRREFGCKLLNPRVDQTRKSRWMADSAKFPVNFPVSREFAAETGSQLTASSARQSGLGTFQLAGPGGNSSHTVDGC